eukprot:SAG22_NODE_1846_length_3451_cov_2.525358_2_plen_146_part_00
MPNNRAQVFCRTNTTAPKPILDFQRVFGTLHEDCQGLGADIENSDWGIGIREPCLCGHFCKFSVLGGAVLLCLCCLGKCIERRYAQHVVKHAPSLGLAVAIEDYKPDRSTRLQVPVRKGEVVEVLMKINTGKQWWEVQKMQSSDR